MNIMRFDLTSGGTYGMLLTDDRKEICKTLELPWKDNLPRISCIPTGTYTCHRRFSHHFQLEVFEITGVPGQADILMHPANYTSELLGCVALGTSFADLNHDGVQDVASSRDAFTAFMQRMQGIDSFTLTVSDVPIPGAA